MAYQLSCSHRLVSIGLLIAGLALGACRAPDADQFAGVDPGNAEYGIEGQRVRLTAGSAEFEAAPGSASKIVTRYLGNSLATDLDGDGSVDAAFWLTQETGGSGLFFYIAAALATGDGTIGSSALLIGDRITPLAIVPEGVGSVVINYLDRAPGDPFSASPTMEASRHLQFDRSSLSFVEIAVDASPVP